MARERDDESGGEDELDSDEDMELDAPVEIKDELKSRHRLKTPSPVQYNMQELFEWLESGEIDLSPSYQREVVWTESKQRALLDSIDANMFIPSLVFALDMVEKNGKVREVRRCIDGKQRLTTIWKFMTGQIAYKLPLSRKETWYTKPAPNATKSKHPYMLPDDWKKEFRNKELVAVEYENLRPDDEREIFMRVQKGVALTTAELLRVGDTPRNHYISDLCERFRSKGKGVQHRRPSSLNWATARARDFEAFACIAYMISELPDRPNPTAARLKTWLDSAAPPDKALARAVEAVLVEFWRLARSAACNFPFTGMSHKVAPLEFVMIAMLIHDARFNALDDAQRAAEVFRLRRTIHAKFPNTVRKNNDGIAYAWGIIDTMGADVDEDLKAIAAAVMEEHERELRKAARRLDGEESEEEVEAEIESQSPRKRGRKRKGADENEEEVQESPKKKGRKPVSKAEAKRTPRKRTKTEEDEDKPSSSVNGKRRKAKKASDGGTVVSGWEVQPQDEEEVEV